MRIPDQFRKSVAFLFSENPDERGHPQVRPVGTAFYIGVNVREEEPRTSAIYAVTARHVVDNSRPDGELYVRLRRNNGVVEGIRAPHDNWVSHPTDDVAVISVGLPFPEYDLRWIPADVLATKEYVAQHNVGPGDELFFMGLFSPYPGFQNDQPIVRFGHVAMMPDEPVPVKINPASETYDGTMEAYLAEVRSWGGHSGSPAFVFFPPDRTPGRLEVGLSRIALLGLVRGHYDIEQAVQFVGDVFGAGRVPVNAGIALIVPAHKIMETLMLPELVEDRQRGLAALEERERREAAAPTGTPQAP